MRKTLISALAVTALLLTGCGDDSAKGNPADSPTPISVDDAKSTSLDEVEVTGEATKKPEVKFSAPLVIEKPAHRTILEGDGETIKEGQQVTAHLTIYSGDTGEFLESSYDNKNPAGFALAPSDVNQHMIDALKGAKVNSRTLVSFNGPYQSAQTPQTLVYVVDVANVEDSIEPLDKAQGKEVELPDDLPKVTRDSSGKPSIEAPEGDPPTELVVEPTVEGDGPEVHEGQVVNAKYTGWLWDDTSKPFDSSWERPDGNALPVTVGQGAVIQGWDEGLVGQKYGSQVLMIVPPDKGYGEQGAPPNIPGNATLIFVVDILPPDGSQN
ncbi:FKBP-type peptidyl-prolyl cis-trans isomerase [Brevibacterium otitidis]|uniref:peptidylprolyl isomerase n=1 Tax=Brevibacterium otitidis TaxID=53364 RepID=A0ABV5WYD0_9MICO|nr:FKBP-type peptidyl-prolyl cis-trans isomerase [Brevibacterium otitidis]